MMARSGESARVLWSGLNHPEGLAWDDGRECLYAGGEGGEIYRGFLDGRFEKIASCGEGSFVLGLALDARGDLYICERGRSRLLHLDTATLTLTEISRGTAARPMSCPNFPVFEASGRLFVSDSGEWGAANGVIYSVDPAAGTTVWSTSPSDFTNGMALAPDRTSLYVVESGSSSVWRIAIEADGSAGASERVWHVPETVPDGLAFDSVGTLYISCFTPDSIHLVDPATGETSVFAHDWSGQHLRAPTNLAFVGDSLDALATANLCGWSLSVFGDLPAAGLPVIRPEVESWRS